MKDCNNCKNKRNGEIPTKFPNKLSEEEEAERKRIEEQQQRKEALELEKGKEISQKFLHKSGFLAKKGKKNRETDFKRF